MSDGSSGQHSEQWVCEGCGAVFAEYINGCPHCSEHGLHFSVRQPITGGCDVEASNARTT